MTGMTLTDAQIKLRDEIKQARDELYEAEKALVPLQQRIDALVQPHAKEGHVWGPRRPNERDCFVVCLVCGKHRDVWWCPPAPDQVCHYSTRRYSCDYCGQPEDRQ